MEEPFIILLVEDNSAHAELFMRCLEDHDREITFHHVKNGEEGLNYLNNQDRFENTSSYPRPNLILLDLKLPRVSGLQLLATVKESKGLTTIPIVIFSSSQANPDIKQALELGANSYLTKPVDFGAFSLMVDNIISYWAGWDELSRVYTTNDFMLNINS